MKTFHSKYSVCLEVFTSSLLHNRYWLLPVVLCLFSLNSIFVVLSKLLSLEASAFVADYYCSSLNIFPFGFSFIARRKGY